MIEDRKDVIVKYLWEYVLPEIRRRENDVDLGLALSGLGLSLLVSKFDIVALKAVVAASSDVLELLEKMIEKGIVPTPGKSH